MTNRPTCEDMYNHAVQTNNSYLNYSDGKRTVTASMNPNMVAGVACGVIAGAALGIYLYKKFCEN